MRKIFAYVVTMVTLLAVMVFFVPSVKESTNFAMEYTGGFEVLYKTTSSMRNVKDKAVADTISDGMNKILDINGVTGAIITVEDGNYIRANVTSNNQIISDEIRDLIQNPDSFEITFRDAEDNELAKGKDILEKVAATYTGETNYYGYPVINLHIKESALDLLRDITTTVSQASDQHLVIWVGFNEETDSYANIETDATIAKKVIYNATVSEPLNETTITITGDYTEEEAKNTVNLINSGTYDYELEVLQIKSVKQDVALRNKTLMLVAVLVSVLLPLVAMCIIFKLDGLFSVIPALFAEFATVFMFNKIAGVINPQVIGAFIIFNVVLFALLFLLLSKYKNVLKTNKSPIKAYKETFKKNSFIMLDTAVTMLIISLVTYFLGTNAHHFAICLAVSSVSVLLTLYLVERFALYLVCDCFNKNDRTVIVSTNNAKAENDLLAAINVDKFTKPAFFGFAGLAGLGLILALVFALVFKAPFNFYGDSKNTAIVEIVTNDQCFNNENEVKEFFDKDNINLDINSIAFDKTDIGYHVTVRTTDDIAPVEEELKAEIALLAGENTEYIENYVVYINDYDSASLLISFKSTLYTSGVALLAVALYFALRYKYSYSLATVTTTLMSIVSVLAFFAITRIPVNSSSVVAISITTAFSLLILVPFFTKIKDYMSETKKVYISYQERVDCFEKGRTSIAPTLMAATIILDASALVIMFFDLSNFSMYVAFILGSLFTLIYTLLFTSKIWLLFESKSDKRKKTFKNKNISKSKYRTLDEQVFIGLND